MAMIRPFQGSLFAEDFLREAITELGDWRDLDDEALADFETVLLGLFNRFPTDLTPNESQTEEDLIWPVLARLGWTAHLRQQNLSTVGRQYVPDGLLFADETAKNRANRFAEEWKRYGHGLAIVESKRWLRPLDRRSGRRGEESAPSTQMLRYLRRIDDVTTGKVRWGILTNGARWRLYWAGARSVSEQFVEIDLAAVLGHSADGRESPPADTRRRWSCSTGSSSSSTPKTATSYPSATAATTTMRSASRYAVALATGRTRATCSRPRRPATGRRSTTCAAPSMRVTQTSACRPTTAGCSTAMARPCFRGFGWVTR